jgi:prepilin-type N-terminal cleavage/methylation domain-containing protein
MKKWAAKQKGFTIVELLIVIVVIAILAAITIVAYNGIQDRANNTAVESDLANIAKKIETWKITNSGNYPTNAELSDVGIRASKSAYLSNTGRNNFYYCASTDLQQYAFGVVAKTNQGYFLTNGNVTTQSGAATYQSQTCTRVGYANGDAGTSGYSTVNGWNAWVNG